ncbi:PIG-L deacetylase family protein [Amycolatopsis minnesotensis]|uniref:PIG-L family deacetylase n=1 Tax=Amycolatopsis minnesotensis TaxID=337894 RepID=A0ABP5CWE0_9PSEU
MSTIVAFHAHPDDEALLTGGTLARAADDGHRVVIVVATDGVIGESEPTRLNELRASARILGVRRVEHLGYADSGHGPLLYPDPPDRPRFVRVPVEEAAERLASLLREESASVLLTYDANGGYGHRDHVRVHEVGKRAAELAGTPAVLEATMPRDALARAVRLTRLLRIPFGYDSLLYSPRSAITHRFDLRRYARRKQAALAAHESVLRGSGRSAAVFRFLVKLPAPVFGLLLGREWYIATVPDQPSVSPRE